MSRSGDTSEQEEDPFALWSEVEVMDVADRAFRWQPSGFHPGESWAPSMNTFFARSSKRSRMVVVIELAGLEPDDLKIEIHEHRLVVRGSRRSPEPDRAAGETVQIQSLEIDHGRFVRWLPLPRRARPEGMTCRYESGMLWIEIPLSPTRSSPTKGPVAQKETFG
ncbi:MAG: Hsp20/alpha crystallin family protein [Phycisphaeraceae bacterium]|nr:Hsp20/alpha crystallin family protein [Phycisphaeraceae bacterium]